MDFQHLVADDELRTELLDRIDELTVVPRKSGNGIPEGFELFRLFKTTKPEGNRLRAFNCTADYK